LVIMDNWNKVNRNAGVTTLGKDRSPWAERRTEDMTIPEDIVVRRLTCEGEDEISRELRAPSSAKEVKRKSSAAWVCLVEAGLERPDKRSRVSLRCLKSDRGGVMDDGEICSRNWVGMRMGLVSRFGWRRRGRSSHGGWGRGKSRCLGRAGMFVSKYERVLASAVSADSSIKVHLIIVDNLIPRHRVQLGIRETSRMLGNFDQRWVRVSRTRANRGSERAWFVSGSHDLPQKGGIRAGRGRNIRNLLGDARSSLALSMVAYGGTKRGRVINSGNGRL